VLSRSLAEHIFMSYLLISHKLIYCIWFVFTFYIV